MTKHASVARRLPFGPMKRARGLTFAAFALALTACAGAVDSSPTAAAGADSPAIQAVALEPPTPAGGMSRDELAALAEGVDGQVDGGEPTAPIEAPRDRSGDPGSGPGLSLAEVESLAAPLAEAEAWLAELEVQWDNGMTYSEIFRAWRSVSAESGPALAAFEIPTDADAAQHRELAAYHASLQGAHDEWQSTVDFIVTYITNYTPEILITKAYQEVEVHLRNAAEHRFALGVPDPDRPEIVIEELVDL